MSVAFYQRERAVIIPKLGFETFVAKLQKAKTRKDKDYFVLRATIPKETAERINAKPGDFLFFQAKKAAWYHMLDWEKMEKTWEMLPPNIRNRIIIEGVPFPGSVDQPILPQGAYDMLGSTSPTSSSVTQLQRNEICQPK